MKLAEFAHLAEAYEDRVAQVANAVLRKRQQAGSEPWTKDMLAWMIRNETEMAGFPMGSVSIKEFTQDVLKSLKGKLSTTPKASSRKEETEQLIQKITSYATDQLGDLFPDGDPGDIQANAFRWFQKDIRKLEDYQSHDFFMNKLWPRVMSLFRKQNGGKDMWDVMADMYDDRLHELAHEAAIKRLDVEDHLARQGYSVDNPYRRHH